MAFSTQLLSLMPHSITVSTRSSHNNYGEASYSTTSSTYQCRIVEKPGFFRAGDGEEVGYSHTIWARSTGATSITVTDRVTLPDGTRPPVKAVERIPDDEGEHHVKIHLGA